MINQQRLWFAHLIKLSCCSILKNGFASIDDDRKMPATMQRKLHFISKKYLPMIHEWQDQ